jgi:hypothetical protein
MGKCTEDKCATCKYWQGTKLHSFADCYRVIGAIEPRLFRFTDDNYVRFQLPLTPWEENKYNMTWCNDRGYRLYFSKCYHDALDKIKEENVLKLEPCEYVGRDGPHEGTYILTPKDYCCKFYKERK